MAHYPRVLLVNHRDGSNEIMACLLWQAGFDVDTAETLAGAAGELRARRYALLICRLIMPDGSGADFIENVWNEFGTPAVALTGTLKSQQMATRIRRDALRATLVLPFMADQLTAAVHTALGTATSEHSAGVQTDRDEGECPDCRGSGTILLLVQRTHCARCRGRGSIPLDVLDIPLRRPNLLGLRARLALFRRGARTLREATRLTDAELQNLPGISDSEAADLQRSIRQLPAQ